MSPSGYKVMRHEATKHNVTRHEVIRHKMVQSIFICLSQRLRHARLSISSRLVDPASSRKLVSEIKSFVYQHDAMRL